MVRCSFLYKASRWSVCCSDLPYWLFYSLFHQSLRDGVIKSSGIIVEFSVFHFNSVSFHFIYFESTHVCDCFIFLIIDRFLTVKWISLSLIIHSVLYHVTITTPAFFCLLFAQYIFPVHLPSILSVSLYLKCVLKIAYTWLLIFKEILFRPSLPHMVCLIQLSLSCNI
jgi:hypothetical protein